MRALLLSLTVLQLSAGLPVGRQGEVQTQHLLLEKNAPDGQSPGGLGKAGREEEAKWKILCEALSCHVPLSGSVCWTNWFLELLCIVRFGIPTELRCLASLNSVSYNFLGIAFSCTL